MTELSRYKQSAEAKAALLQQKKSATVLAIETSCDETAAAVVRNGRDVLSNAVHTQIPLHVPYGGVVPEIASRNHVEMITPVVQTALLDAGLSLNQIDAVAVTFGPGLVGALLVGLNYAKGLAYSTGLPLVGVNHIAGHIAANYISHLDLTPPFVCLVASGGHSHIVSVNGYDSFSLIGRTRDDAAGEAFDKVARILHLPYPGGPNLEKLARTGNPEMYTFHSAFNEGPGYDFSFSGIKTAVINLVHTLEQKGEPYRPEDLAASFQHTVVSILTEKSIRAAEELSPSPIRKTLALAGGVSANTALRHALEQRCAKQGISFFCPDLHYCTDNAAMIGSCAFYQLMSGRISSLTLNADPNLPIV